MAEKMITTAGEVDLVNLEFNWGDWDEPTALRGRSWQAKTIIVEDGTEHKAMCHVFQHEEDGWSCIVDDDERSILYVDVYGLRSRSEGEMVAREVVTAYNLPDGVDPIF